MNLGIVRVGTLALALTAAGCAARRQSIAVDAAAAEALLQAGCYDCLIEAARHYDRALAERPTTAAAVRRFEVQLLLVMRERELAIDDTASLTRARQLASTVPAATDARRHLDIVAMIRPDADGTGGRDAARLPRATGERIREEAAWLRASSPLPIARDYLAAALECELPQPPLPDADSALLPVLRFRLALCGGAISQSALTRVREEEPRFAEAALFLARAGMGTIMNTDGAAVRGWLGEAYARFPDSPAVTLQLGTVWRATGDCARGSTYYGETLALRPRHEDARLGRAICLSLLDRPREAIADATVLIDEMTANAGDAYYWRAWNHHRLKALAAARADIERAKVLRRGADVLTLAGIIEHDQDEFGQARDDLTEARRLDSRYCPAAWHLGVVEFRRQSFPASGAAFALAAACFAGQAMASERARDEMAARTDIDPEFRARQLAGFEAAVREDRSQENAAILNAALNYARADDRENALIYLERVADDPERRPIVEDLRKRLGTAPK